jgi:Uncharacterised nucleotidyltransferase
MRWRSEAQLILCCATNSSSPESRDRVRNLIEGRVDWEVVTRAASRNGVIQAVYRTLVPEFASHLPAPVLNSMHTEVHGHTVRSFHLAAEMVRICGLLENHGVRALAFKGPALAAAVYGDPALRQFSDIDLLVRHQDLSTTLSLLSRSGFQTKAPLQKLHGGFSNSWEATLVRPGGLFDIDLHWRLSPAYFPFTPEGDELWARAIEVEIGTCNSVWTLCPEDLILFLCAHGAKHGWQSLSGVRDVAWTLDKYHYDWERLSARANALGSLRILWLGVLLAHELLAAEVPKTVIDAARSERSVVNAARAFCNFYYQLAVDGPGLFQRWSIPLSMIPGRAARLRYAVIRTFHPAPADFGFVRLPAAFSSAFYLIRPLRIAMQKCRTIVSYAARRLSRHNNG